MIEGPGNTFVDSGERYSFPQRPRDRIETVLDPDTWPANPPAPYWAPSRLDVEAPSAPSAAISQASAASHSDPTGKLSPAKRKRSGSFSSSAVPLKSYIQGTMDVLYYGEIGVGSPTQVLTVDFDTGSADLWVRLPSMAAAHVGLGSR